MRIALITVAALLALAGPSAAQDKCPVGGSSTLQDQRDLAALPRRDRRRLPVR